MKRISVHKKAGEASFTIVETLIALAIMLPVIVESVGTQGAIINASTYMRRVTEATWIAKSVMAKVEYNWRHYDLKELEIDPGREQEYPLDKEDAEFDYTYKLEIKEWKLPLFDLLLQGGPSGGEEDDSPQDEENGGLLGGMPGIDKAIEAIFDGHMLKIAKVEVFWPEGARKDSVSLSLLLTNQRALDAYLLTKSKTMDNLLKKVEEDILGKPKKDTPKTPVPPTTPGGEKEKDKENKDESGNDLDPNEEGN